MPEPVDLGFALGMAPREAIEHFTSKGYEISWNWQEVWQDRHTQAFTVAKAARLDILRTIRGRLDEALAEGIAESEFIRRLEPELRKAGWWGRQVVVGPGGEAELVQLGSPRRLKTIFRTNLATTFAAGRYRRQVEASAGRPYWMYDAILDASTRPAHAALDGKVFRWDDPIWDYLYPPNGWNCRCKVIALSERQARRRGLRVADGRDGLRQVMQEAGLDKRTGEIYRRPGAEYSFAGADGRRHVLTPDPGWSYNPGQGAALFDAKLGRRGRLSTTLDPAIPGQRDWRSYGLPAELPRRPAPPVFPIAESADAAKRQIFDALEGAGGMRLVRTPDGLDDASINTRFVDHLVDHHPRQAGREQFARWILPTLRDPDEVWLQASETRSGVEYRRVFVAGFDDERFGRAVTQELRDGSWLWTFYTPINSRRTGRLLYRRPPE